MNSYSTTVAKLTYVFRRKRETETFEGVIAEIPGPYAEGETLQEVREALTHRLLQFLASNCQAMLGEMGESAVTETVTLTMTPDSLKDDVARRI